MALESRASSTQEIKDRLKNLREYFPGQEEITYDFAAYLAERLNPEHSPEGFSRAIDLALYTLQKSASRSTSQPVQNRLIGSAPIVYVFLRTQVPEIADAVCPKEFAQDVRRRYDTCKKWNEITENLLRRI